MEGKAPMMDWPPRVESGAHSSGCSAAHSTTLTVLLACGEDGSEKALRSRPVRVVITSRARLSFSGGAVSSCSTSSSTSNMGGGELPLEVPQATASARSQPARVGASRAVVGTGGTVAAG